MKNNKIVACVLTASLLYFNTGANAENPGNENSVNPPESTTNSTTLPSVEPYNSNQDLPKDPTSTTNNDSSQERIFTNLPETTQTDNNPNYVVPSSNNDPSSMPISENPKQELNSDQNKEDSRLTPKTLETKEKKESKFKSFFQKGDKSQK